MSCSALTNLWGYFRADLGDIHWLIRRMWTGCLVGQKSETYSPPQKMDLTYKYHCFQWKLETIHGILLADIETGFGTAATLSPFQACVSDTHSTLCGCTSHMLGYCTKLTTPPISRLSSPNFESLATPQKVNSKSHCEMVDSNDPFRTWQLPVVFDPPKCPKIVSPDFSGQEFLQIM